MSSGCGTDISQGETHDGLLSLSLTASLLLYQPQRKVTSSAQITAEFSVLWKFAKEDCFFLPLTRPLKASSVIMDKRLSQCTISRSQMNPGFLKRLFFSLFTLPHLLAKWARVWDRFTTVIQEERIIGLFCKRVTHCVEKEGKGTDTIKNGKLLKKL